MVSFSLVTPTPLTWMRAARSWLRQEMPAMERMARPEGSPGPCAPVTNFRLGVPAASVSQTLVGWIGEGLESLAVYATRPSGEMTGS